MPLYEFQCRECGHHFETLVFATTRSQPACPVCDGHNLEKLFSVFGVGSAGGSGGRATSTASFSGG